jgi:hypothetical protein
VPDPVLVLKVIGLARKMCRQRRLQRNEVVSMDAIDPLRREADSGRRRQAKHRLPSA